MIKEERDLLTVLSFESLLKHKTITHFVSTRRGGCSNPPFDSLNLGLHVGDNPDLVFGNRERLAHAVGMPLSRFTFAKQIHSSNVTVITGGQRGKGAFNQNEAIDATDAMVTDLPGICLVILIADCVPLLLFDPFRNVIGVAHAGWKGTLRSIALHTVRAMEKGFGCSPHNIIVGIGPSIGPCCYEVGPEVIAQVKAAFSPYREYVTHESGDGKGRLDLRKANRDQLVRTGIKRENIETANQCTCHNADIFFSYRQQHGETGRFGAGICIL